MAAVALEHRLNANLLRRWVVEEERVRETGLIAVGNGLQAPSPGANAAFVPVEVTSPAVGASQEIVIEVRRGATIVKMSWPLGAAAACSAWLRGLLK